MLATAAFYACLGAQLCQSFTFEASTCRAAIERGYADLAAMGWEARNTPWCVKLPQEARR